MAFRTKSASILTFLFIISILFIGCEKETKKIRFAVIKYQQETCTFCPGGDAGIKDWTTNGPYLKGEKLINYNNGEPNSNYISGFVHQAKAYKDVEVIGINSPSDVISSQSSFFPQSLISNLSNNSPF